MRSDRSTASGRRYPHLDFLRVSAMLGVLVFHSGRAFDSEGWHIKSPVRGDYFDIQTALLSQWLMPIFFIISGWVTYLALRRSSASTFAWSRVKRLGIPFVLGTLIVVPPQVYIERATQSGVAQSYIEWFPHYFDGWYAFGGNFAWMGLHLWYLQMLLVFSLLLLPVFLVLRAPQQSGALPGWVQIVVAALALFAVELYVDQYRQTIGLRDFGGWSPLTYIVWFLIGHAIGRSDRFQAALIASRWVAVAIALVAVVLGIAFVSGLLPDMGPIGEFVIRVGVAWGGIVAMLGFAAKRITQKDVLLSFADRYVLQFYVLHQTVIVLVVYWTLGWQADAFPKFLVTLVASFAIIVALLAIYNFARARIVDRSAARPA